MDSQIEQIASSVSKPHAVVVPFPAQGHINPMMHLSKKLARKGFVITFVNSQHNHLRMVHDNKVEFLTSTEDTNLDIRLEGIPDGLPPDHSRTGKLLELFEAITKLGTVFEVLIERLLREEPKVTCIISDIFVLFTQDVANKFKIPRVAFYTQSAASFAVHVMVREGFRPSGTESSANSDNSTNDNSSSIIPNLISCIPGGFKLQTSDMISFLVNYDPSDFSFDHIIRPFRRLDEAASVIFNSFDELEHIALEALRKLQEITMYTVGPLLPSDFFTKSFTATEIRLGLWREDYSCLEWLKTQAPRSVLYISFGSVAGLTARGIEELALGLEASEQPILWVVRPDFMWGGFAVFPEGFKERMERRSLFISWAPQLHVLSNPSIGGFLTHCGWNSTLESISSGVPMLGWPFFADQKLDCRCIVDGWKVGLRLEPEEEGVVSRKQVEQKVRILMQGKDGEDMRERARKLRDAAREASSEGGSSSKDFNNLVDHLMKLSSASNLSELNG